MRKIYAGMNHGGGSRQLTGWIGSPSMHDLIVYGGFSPHGNTDAKEEGRGKVEKHPVTDAVYRFRTAQGLSKEYSLKRLQEKTLDGSVAATTECTTDNGNTWTALGTLIMSSGDSRPSQNSSDVVTPESSEPQQDPAPQSDSTTTSLNSQDGTVAMNRDQSTDADADARSRKLKRVAKGSGESRYAKLSEDRRRQKTGGVEHKTPDDFIGLILGGGRYKVLGKLGKGSMAYVFRARDDRLETDVVIKIPKPEKLEGEEIRERFQKESQLLVRLAHPNVVNVLDVGEHDRVPYVVMQLLSGGTLLDKMDDVQGKVRRMKPSFLKTWLREVARALDYCAKQGTVHRDVKPANILFDDDGNGYIADFGLTKIMFGEHTALNSSDTTAGIVLGTPNYIAPEIVLGKPYDGRADQYSLGITVYHALIGRPPMQGASATVTMINQTQKRLQLLSDVCSDVPKEMALAIRKCIEKDSDKRFDSCEEFAEAVIDGLRGSSASSMSMSGMAVPPPVVAPEPPKPAVTKRKRKPGQSAASGARRRKSSGSASGSSRVSAPAAAIPPEPYLDDSYLDDIAGGDGADWLADPSTPSPTRSKKKKSGKKGKGRGRKQSANTVKIGSLELPRIPFFAGLSVAAALLIVGVTTLFSSTPDTPEQSFATAAAQNPNAPNGGGGPVESRPNKNVKNSKQEGTKSYQATSQAATEQNFVVLNATLNTANLKNVTEPNGDVKVNVWDGTCHASEDSSGSIIVRPGSGPWWGCGLEVPTGSSGENLTQFGKGQLHFDLRSETQSVFTIGFQTGSFANGTQTNNFVTVNETPGLRASRTWQSHSVPVSKLQQGADLKDVTTFFYVRGERGTDGKQIEFRNVYYSAAPETKIAANRRQGGKKNRNGKSGQPRASANGQNKPPTKVAEAPKIQQISASKTAAPATNPARKSVSAIPWKAGEKVTASYVDCPVVVVGNNVWSKEENKFTATLSGQYSTDAATAISPEGTLFAASKKTHHASNNDVTVWDLTTGDQLLTIPGSAERGMDAILMSEDIVYVASRTSNVLLRWNCREKKQLPPHKMSGAVFSDRNTTISNDGQFIATTINGRMTVWSTANGQPVAEMTNPSAKPLEKRSSLTGNGLSPEMKPAQDATEIFDELQYVTFSPDNQFLSAFSNHSGGRMICWNGSGEIVADHAAYVRHQNSKFQPAIAWFDVDRSWLTASRVTARRQGRVVMVLSTAEESPYLNVYGGNHFVGIFDFSPDRLSIVHLPMEKVNKSLASLRENGAAAILSRETPVSMELNLAPYFTAASPEFLDLRKAFRQAVNRDGLKVEKESPMVFSLNIASGEESLPIYERFNNPGRRTQALSVAPDESYLVMQLQLPNQPEPIWRRRLVSTEKLQSNPDMEALIELVGSTVVPYFIPAEDEGLALPVMIH